MNAAAGLRATYAPTTEKPSARERHQYIASLPPLPTDNVAANAEDDAADGMTPNGATDTRATPDKATLLTLSVTVINPADDLPLVVWDELSTWLQTHTISGAFGLERGDTEHQLHAQGVIK